jgi:hypothetical protein
MPKHRTSRLRAPRVTVPNDEQVIVSSVESKPVVGILVKLSATGGSVRVSKSYMPGALGEISLKTASGKVTAAIEFLRTGVDGVAQAQAFRFVHIEPADRRRLENALDQMREHGLGEKQRGTFQPLVRLTQRGLTIAKKRMIRVSRAFSG